MSSASRSPDGLASGGPPCKVRFGLFTFDLHSGELYRADRRLRIQQQCVMVLTLLLENPGELVSREKLTNRLWPADTFVDFEDGLNTVVRKLRNALGDNAENPRFIETVPRRGYRFIAPVGVIAEPGIGDQKEPDVHAAVSSSEPLQKETSSHPKRVLGVVAIVLIAVAGIGIWKWSTGRRFPHAVLINQLTHSGVVHPNQNMVVDGSRLYYIERERGDWILKSMALGGGPGTPVQLAFSRYDIQDISPDLSELLIRKLSTENDNESLWIEPVVGGAARRVGDFGVLAATFDPTGKSITYSDGEKVYRCSREGGDIRELFHVNGNVYRLRWSPRGDVLTFTLANGATHQTSLWAVNADGSDMHPLLPNWNLPKWEWMMGWSPAGRWLAFSADRDGGRDIWLTDRRGRTPQRITTGPLRFDLPVFSRDGKTIYAIGGQQRGELLRYDATLRSFSPFLGGLSAEQVQFSPDGKLVTYVSYPDRVLWVAHADGSGAIRLTDAPAQAGYPQFSKNGKVIGFLQKSTRAAPWKLFVVSAEGGSPKPIAMGDVEAAGFVWHPDGKSIVLSCSPCDALRVVDAESGKYSTIPNSADLKLPKISPSGRFIVAETGDSSNHELLDLSTGERKKLLLDALYPTWSSDERYIYFNRFHGSHPAMFRIRMSDMKEEQLFVLTDFPPAGSMSMYSGLTPEGAPLLLRDLGGADIFAVQLSDE